MLIALALSMLVLAALELSDNEIGLYLNLNLNDTAIGILITFSANPAAGFSAKPVYMPPSSKTPINYYDISCSYSVNMG